jgi:hypothetical protein
MEPLYPLMIVSVVFMVFGFENSYIVSLLALARC